MTRVPIILRSGSPGSPQNAPTLDALTTTLQGRTVTQGWDVVHAMSADKVNDLLKPRLSTNYAPSIAPDTSTVSFDWEE